MDTLDDFDAGFPQELEALAKMHDLLIFEDRKFNDIGNTVVHQYEGGTFKISRWAHIVNCHTLPGPGILTALSSVAKRCAEPRACLVIAQMSSEGNLCSGAYARASVEMALASRPFVIGLIAQDRSIIPDGQDLLLWTPVRV